MTVWIVGDVHLGNHAAFGGALTAGVNKRARLVLDAIDRAVAMVKPNDRLVIAGDLFDRHDATPQLVGAARVSLRRCPRGLEDVIAIPGNHDRVTAQPGDHAMAGLDPALVVDEPLVVPAGTSFPAWIVCAPVVSGVPPLEVAAQALQLARGYEGAKLLVMHAGLEDETTAPWLRGGGVRVDQLARLCAAAGVDTVVAGDWHTHASYHVGGVELTQIGALAPTGWDNEGMEGYGSVLAWEPKTRPVGVVRHIVAGPRFVTVGSRGEVASAQAFGPAVFVRVRGAKPEDGDNADGVVALPAPAASPTLPAGAAVEDAVAAWIRGQPAEPDVAEAAVALTRKFLGAA